MLLLWVWFNRLINIVKKIDSCKDYICIIYKKKVWVKYFLAVPERETRTTSNYPTWYWSSYLIQNNYSNGCVSYLHRGLLYLTKSMSCLAYDILLSTMCQTRIGYVYGGFCNMNRLSESNLRLIYMQIFYFISQLVRDCFIQYKTVLTINIARN